MKHNDSTTTERASKFRHMEILYMERISRILKDNQYVEPEILTEALRKSKDRQISDDVLEYICDLIEGKIKKPRGRNPMPSYLRLQWGLFVTIYYNKYFNWLRNRKAKYAHLNGWSSMKGKDWWQGPPNERAARMVAVRYHYGAKSWRSIHNIVSSRKTR